MAKLLKGSINLNKIDKSKLFTGKTGDKYLNVVIWVNDDVDQYGNCASVQQDQTKEERDAGAAKIYLGNLKDPRQNQDNGLSTATSAPAAAPAQSVADDGDLPF